MKNENCGEKHPSNDISLWVHSDRISHNPMTEDEIHPFIPLS